MDESLFRKPSGRLHPLVGGGVAFVPAPLPPRLTPQHFLSELSMALTAIGELKGAARRLANPLLLIQPMQLQEALTSSAMEGTYTTAEELVLAEADPAGSAADTREVANFTRALRHAEQRLREGQPIAHRLLCETHAILLEGVERHRGAHRLPGQYKRDQNFIGGSGIDARFVPPPPDLAPALMADLERFINETPPSDPAEALINIALAHYQFETIHPFADGNGRMGRMLITLLARQWGLVDHMLLYVSPELEALKDRYINLMFEVSACSAWEAWIVFMMHVFSQSCARTVQTIDRLLALQDDFHERARKAGRSAHLLKLVDRLFETPVLTVPQVQRELELTYRGAQQLVEKLQDAGIVAPVLNTRPQTFLASAILDIIRPTAR